ncbi:MAG: VCBS repeat-containing protein, partial [Saprospiraceae bacterium]|nr:VCBS repeat-containing protein [Saprospiraceae bacterium]
DGNYVYNSQILDSYSASKTIVGDLDNDADLDIIRGSSVFLNNGEAIFTPGDRIDYSFTGKAIGLGDINGDDFLDLVVANITNPNTNSKSFMVLTNDKTGKFTFLNFFGNSVISEFALIDLDGDEDLDIVSAVINNFESDQKYNSTWINDGEGAFSEQSRFGNAQSYGLDFGDLDNDGDLDFFFANRFNNEFGDFSHCIYFVKNPTSILKSIEDNDELQNIQISLSQDTFSLADLGENFVTVTATDASGNSSSCVAKVTVSDCGCFPSSSPLIPNSVSGMHVADCKTVDGAFTHYCDSQGRLLLSLDSETAATVSPEDVSIKIAQGGFYYNKFCTNVSGTHTGDCFISNDDGSVVLCRTWDVNSPATNARVRYYFSQSDIDIVNQENYNRGLTPITDPSQFWFYKVLNGEGHAKPEDLALSDVKIIDNDGTGLVSTNNWRLGNVPGGYFAEYAVNSFSGGGGGIAEKGSSPVCPVIEASIRGDGLPDSLGLSSVVFVDILGGNSPYRVILGNGTTVEQYHSGDSIIVFSNFASGDLSILSVVDSLGCPHSTLSGSVPQFFPLGDSISPVALCKDTILTLDQFNMAHLSAKELDAGSTDNDFIVTYSLTRSTFSCADFGDLQVEMSVFDQSGNSASCFSNITISDPLNACCPNLRLLEQIPATTKSYSGQMIHSNAEVKLGVGLTDIRFLAQESILLLDNFEVKEGAVFSAEIYPCDLNLIKQKVRKID